MTPVSILAPRCRGAQRTGMRAGELCGLFQSSPPVAGGRNLFTNMRPLVFNSFQSSPPVAGGRNAAKKSPCAGASCFNPRPPLPGGATDAACGVSATILVSILAPRCRGAQPFIFNSLSMQIFLPALRERRLERVVTSCFAALNQ